MLGSPPVWSTPNVMGMETHSRWVSVTVQAVPSALAVQVAAGSPVQETLTVPTSATGVSTTGVLTLTHCVPVLAHPAGGRVGPPPAAGSA